MSYFKSLFPWRWLIPLTLILLYAYALHLALPAIKIFTSYSSPVLWHSGNVLFWIFIDWAFGLGREGSLFKTTIKL